jgi:hypothetical protein
VWLNSFAGSELVTLELYDHFSNQGHNVEIFTNTVSREIEEYLALSGTHYSTPSSFVPKKEYDLVWIQHQNIPNNFFEENPLVGKCIFHHMSPIEPLEFTLNADFENIVSDQILTNSLETAEKLNSLGIDMSKVQTFGNPAPQGFFEFPDQKKSNSYFLFISNHPPDVLLEAMDMLSEMGKPFIHLGMGSNWAESRRVVPSDLAGASAVISIGKTIQYCIAMQKTFFIYDYFGGDGFVSSVRNFQDNVHFNFSGRNSKKKKTSKEILLELLDFEANNPYELKYVTQVDRDSYHLPTKINEIFEEFDFSEKTSFLRNVEPKDLGVFQGALTSLRRSIIGEGNLSKGYRSAVAERDSAVAERDSAVAERDSAVAERDSAVAERDSAVAERDSIANSTIWKLFGPYRKVIRFIRII